MAQRRIGPHADFENSNAGEVLEVNRQIQPTVSLVMTGDGKMELVNAILDACPRTDVVHRLHNPSVENFLHQTYGNAKNLVREVKARHGGRKRVIEHLMNEPARKGSEEQIRLLKLDNEFLCEAMHEGYREGTQFVVGNVQPEAAVEPGSGLWDDVITVASQYQGFHHLGFHHYVLGDEVTGYLNDAQTKFNYERMQKPNWITRERFLQVASESYHLGRYRRWIDRARVLGVRNPSIIFTEILFDKRQNQPGWIYDTLRQKCGREPHGQHTYADFWRELWPYWDYETALFEQLAHFEDVHPAEVFGMCFFSFSREAQWRDGWNMEGYRKVWELYSQYQPRTPLTDAAPIPAPMPTVYGQVRYQPDPPDDVTPLNVRLAPPPAPKNVLTTVTPAQVLDALDADYRARIGKAGEWLRVQTPNGTIGYSAAWLLAEVVGPPTDWEALYRDAETARGLEKARADSLQAKVEAARAALA